MKDHAEAKESHDTQIPSLTWTLYINLTSGISERLIYLTDLEYNRACAEGGGSVFLQNAGMQPRNSWQKNPEYHSYHHGNLKNYNMNFIKFW
jgi:hypothetical protein